LEGIKDSITERGFGGPLQAGYVLWVADQERQAACFLGPALLFTMVAHLGAMMAVALLLLPEVPGGTPGGKEMQLRTVDSVSRLPGRLAIV
jgi:hypothetical protein